MDEMRPDLLITRPYINSMPGRIAANYLRNKHPGLPVLIVAGFVDNDRLNVQNAIEEFYTFPRRKSEKSRNTWRPRLILISAWGCGKVRANV